MCCRETNRIAQAAVTGLTGFLLQVGPDLGLTHAHRVLSQLLPFLQMAWIVPRNAKLKVWLRWRPGQHGAERTAALAGATCYQPTAGNDGSMLCEASHSLVGQGKRSQCHTSCRLWCVSVYCVVCVAYCVAFQEGLATAATCLLLLDGASPGHVADSHVLSELWETCARRPLSAEDFRWSVSLLQIPCLTAADPMPHSCRFQVSLHVLTLACGCRWGVCACHCCFAHLGCAGRWR